MPRWLVQFDMDDVREIEAPHAQHALRSVGIDVEVPRDVEHAAVFRTDDGLYEAVELGPDWAQTGELNELVGEKREDWAHLIAVIDRIG